MKFGKNVVEMRLNNIFPKQLKTGFWVSFLCLNLFLRL